MKKTSPISEEPPEPRVCDLFLVETFLRPIPDDCAQMQNLNIFPLFKGLTYQTEIGVHSTLARYVVKSEGHPRSSAFTKNVYISSGLRSKM